MPTQLAHDDPHTLATDTIGEAWFAVARRILARGVASRYDDLPIREIAHVTLAVARPDPADPVIAAHADPARLAWMHANFTDHTKVAALGDADSYATRLFDYSRSGRDFGAKGYGNLVELATPQHRVADALGMPVGRLLMTVKSAHVYDTEADYVRGLRPDAGA